MKRVLLLVVMAGLLTGCGSRQSASSVACDQQYWNGEFATCLPKGWRVLSQDTLKSLGVPEETVAAFQVQDAHAGQFDTVTVTKEPLAQDLTTPEYSQANIIAVSSLPDYKLIDKIVVTVGGKESAIHVFSARTSADQPIRRYYQLSAAKERTGYTFTGSFPLSIADSEGAEVQFILKNIGFTDPAGEEKK